MTSLGAATIVRWRAIAELKGSVASGTFFRRLGRCIIRVLEPLLFGSQNRLSDSLSLTRASRVCRLYPNDDPILLSMFQEAALERPDHSWRDHMLPVGLSRATVETLRIASTISALTSFVDVCLLMENLLTAAASMETQWKSLGREDRSIIGRPENTSPDNGTFETPGVCTRLEASTISKYIRDSSMANLKDNFPKLLSVSRR